VKIVIVPEQACPWCGAYSGHPDKALDWPNRPKVDNAWKCFNPECEVAFYEDGEVVELKMSPEEEAAMHAATAEWVANITFGKTWAEVEPGVYKLVPDG